jgi:peptide/nickel transport system substrate-binding protein
LVVSLSLVVAACDVSDIPRDPKRITMAVSRDISSLDPAATFLLSNQLAMNLAYEKLVVAEVADGQPTGRMLGQLAERWEASADGLVWTFFLHPGHRFDDGSEVTAEAVKFSFERTLTLKAPPSQFLFSCAASRPWRRTRCASRCAHRCRFSWKCWPCPRPASSTRR